VEAHYSGDIGTAAGDLQLHGAAKTGADGRYPLGIAHPVAAQHFKSSQPGTGKAPLDTLLRGS